MQCLITAIVAVILLVGVASSCPSVCDCINTSNRINVSCSSRGLNSTPTELPTNTYILWLDNNNISVIENTTFNNLTSLQDLYLHNNKITSIKSDTFNNLTNLVRLELQYNDISVIENNIFNNLPSLQYLLLNNNNISVIENHAFNNLPSLQDLRIDNNPIAFVSEYAFENLPNLTSLAFDMHCGSCSIIPFWEWLKGYHTFSISIACKDFNGTYLSSVQLNNVIDCSDGPIQIKISPPDTSYTVNETGSVNQINCTADCNPSCTTNWTGPNLSAGSTSILNLQNINRSQAGVYTCTAFNETSSLTLIKVNVIVNFGPRQVVIYPTTSNYTRNETLDGVGPINCTANCQPACTSTWNGPNLPSGTTSVLSLPNINRTQAGNYQCTASNNISSLISATIYVVVNYGPIQIEISPPDTTYTVIEKGSVNQINCTADCSPSCTTTWTGPNLPAGFTSILNLQNISRSQAGLYNCTAFNEISSLTLIKINVIVNFGPRQVVIYPTTSNYTRNETLDGVGPINCTANCQPACTSTWNGPNLPSGTTSVLSLPNINRTQAGNYQCTASNNVSSLISATIYVVVNFGPRQVVIYPTTSNYTRNETLDGVGPINCTANCQPACTSTWNGPNLPSGTTSVLSLPNINRTQAGNYQCTASNNVSSLISATIYVVVNYGPIQIEISPPDSTYTVIETGSVNQITCTADCSPSCTTTWTGPNLPANSTSILNLQHIDRGQAGVYNCTAVNEISSLTLIKVNVIVNFGPRQVVIYPTTSNYTRNETLDGVGPINCTANCQPACTSTWNGPNLPSGTTSVLSLPNINRTQAGNYQCTASNNVSSLISATIYVVVNYGPIQIEISPPDSTYTVIETGSVNQITCTADCSPSCTTTWTGPNLPANSTSILNLQHIDRGQAGVYNCTAVNEISSLTLIKVNVIVNFGPRQVVIYPTTSNYTRNETLDGVGPINCTANCQPACTSTWNGPNLPSGTTSVLSIPNINRTQAGNYQCTASNNVSSLISATIYVVVNYGPIQIEISPPDSTYTVIETGSVNQITCTADCSPSCTTTWTGPNLPANSTSILNLQHIDRGQAGVYNCTAVNDISSLTLIKVNVIVNFGPRQVVIYPTTSNYTRNETLDGVGPINCTANCQPACTSTWNGPNLPSGTTSVLSLPNINRTQAGNYQCTASNNVSSLISATIYVVVNYGPIQIEISPPDSTYTVIETGSVNQITCTADCSPSCTTTWTGPNLPANSTSILNLQHIDRGQAGVYNCTAVNDISSLTLIKVNVIVNFGPRQVVIYPTTSNYTMNETLDGVGPINCTANCQPACTSTWNGPNLPSGTTSVLSLPNINRTQAGNYQCTASNNVSSLISATIYVVVNYGPIQIEISPPDSTYTVIETGSVNQITCTADCSPSCTTTWTGPNLPANSTSILNLQHIDRGQAGVYNCTAVNDISSLTLIKVNVIVNFGPRQVVIYPTTSNYTRNETLDGVGPINCTANCQPACTNTWNGPNLPSGTTSVLSLPNINRTQAGNYQCTASNNVSSLISATIYVVVNYGPIQIEISPPDSTYTVIETGSVNQITCTADCSPSCTTTWTGPNLPANSTSILNLQHIDRGQAGVYNCTAVNDISSLTLIKVNVIVNFGPRQVVIYPTTSNYTRNETLDGVGPINCTANCQPACTSTWNGPNLPSGTTSVLSLPNINRTQAGNYQCTASNNVSSLISATIYVVVNYGPIQIEISPPDSTYTVIETGSVNQITCTADCSPSCTTTWTGPNLPANSTSILNLQHIDRGQAGVYNCTAVNDISSLTLIKVNVIVNFGPRQVVIYPTTSNYTRNETLDGVGPINCTANCQPACTSTWNGPNLPSGTTSVLSLPNINRTQAGNYQCTASNNVSSLISATIYVVVNYGPIQIEISPPDSTYTVIETGSVNQITCTADCSPSCTTTWTGPNLPANSTSILNLQHIDRGQAGVYNCTAVNDISSLTLIKVNVIVNFGPRQVVIYPTTSNYTRNETLDGVGPINCTANCQPACTSTWNGPNLPSGTTSVLSLPNINRTQAGNYQCTASNNVSSLISATIYVVVNYGPIQIEISPPDSTYTVIETGSVNQITCTADCSPSCTTTWTGPNLPANSTSILNLQHIDRGQAGVYNCTAVNEISSLTLIKVNVIVNFGPRQVVIYPTTSNYTRNETLDGVGPINCTANCQPACTSTWNGPNLPSGTTSVLSLPNINRTQAGNYQCTASNNVSSMISATIYVVVVNYGPIQIEISPPDSTYTVIETGSVNQITCTADCSPSCTTTWTGPNLPANSTSILNLQHIDRGQAGVYNCTAVNEISSLTLIKVNVIVNYQPTISSISSNKKVSENDTTTVDCTVDSIPQSFIRWIFETKELQNKYDSSLTLNKIDCLSMGRYTCQAVNMLGVDNRYVDVTVKCSPRINRIEFTIPSTVAVKDKDMLNITAHIIAFPKPEMYWQFGHVNVSSGITKSFNINRHSSNLVKSNLTQDDFGTYSVFAYNGVGNTHYLLHSVVVVHAIAAKPAENKTALYTGVGASIATAIVIIIILLVILRRKKTGNQGLPELSYANPAFTDAEINSGVHNTEPHYVATITIPVVQEHHYDTIQTSTALCHTWYNKSA